MTVENGVIVPDARWISDTSDDGTPVFRLMADTDDLHCLLPVVSLHKIVCI